MRPRRWLLATAVLVVAVVGAHVIATNRGHVRWPFHLRRWLRRDHWVELTEHGHQPKPSPEEKRAGLIAFVRDPLERIYATSRPRPADRLTTLSVIAARDQYEPLQVGVYALRPLSGVSVSVSDLVDATGDRLPAAQAVVRMVRFYGAALSARHRDRFGVVPKTLEPAVPLDVAADTVRPYWITVHVPADQPGGLYRGTVRIAHAHGATEIPLSVEVLPTILREPDILYGTLSINPLARISEALAHPHGPIPGATLEETIHLAGADDLLAQAEVMLRDQKAHGMNTISPWASKEYAQRGNDPYLRDVEVAILLYRSVGFTKPMLYQMGTLLHTNKNNRAGSYREFDRRRDLGIARDVAHYYTQRFARAGLPGLVFLPIEEPNLSDGVSWRDPPDARQRLAREVLAAIRDAGGRTGVTCTPDSAQAVGDLADYWIVAYRTYQPEVLAAAAAAGAHVAIYANFAMMGQNTYAPRFLFGYFVWANRLAGMLPWTYPSQPNRFPVNVGRRGEGGLDVREGFLGSDGRPIPTIQWELSRVGIDDAKYLATLEALADEAARADSAAARALATETRAFLDDVRRQVGADLHRYTFEHARTSEPVPEGGWDVARFQQTRARAVDLLRRLLAIAEPPHGGAT
ncbi:MAG: DUF6067 family protein [Candidatus Binatia bacterium]